MEDLNKEIEALLQLLDDPDEEVYIHIAKKIKMHGDDIIPVLEKAWETSLNSILQQRIEDLIQEIQFTGTKNKLEKWIAEGGKNIAEGAFYIAQYQYPDLKYRDILAKLDKLKQDVWLEINDNLTALEKVRVLNHVLYKLHGFTGNSSNFYAPQNSFINHVLSTQKGNPVSLGIIYIYIAQELEIPIFGVNLPKNFILCYQDMFDIEDEFFKSILFYINPFNRGAVLGKREIDYFLKQERLKEDDRYYEACSNKEVIKKLLESLIYSYSRLGYPEKEAELKEIYKLFNN